MAQQLGQQQQQQEEEQMGSLFRSQHMSLVQLYIPTEIAQATVAELGDLGCIQFRDLNPTANAFQRPYVNEIRRLDEMERKLRYLIRQARAADVPIKPLAPAATSAAPLPDTDATHGLGTPTPATAPTGIPIGTLQGGTVASYRRSRAELDDLSQRLVDLEARLRHMSTSQAALDRRRLELTELRHVLRETAIFFEAVAQDDDPAAFSPASVAGVPGKGSASPTAGPADGQRLGFVAGVLERKKMATFERILWRALRGNLYMNYAEIEELIEDPVTGTEQEKNVFIIFAHGQQTIAKIQKICASLGATLYPIDDSPERRRGAALEVLARIEDVNNVLVNTNQARRAELAKVAEHLESWIMLVRREKAIYHTMNRFTRDSDTNLHSANELKPSGAGNRSRTLIAEGWCPTFAIRDVSAALRAASQQSGTMVSSILTRLHTQLPPPTYHVTTPFTAGFQAVTDAYGVARYREINPALFSVITFPFLFAVMFGDFGHATILLLVAAFLVLKERSLYRTLEAGGEMWQMVFGGRYLLLMMAAFSFYSGLLYNDAFSRAFNVFHTTWKKSSDGDGLVSAGVYPFGVDPSWYIADNALVFLNSYKMKQAILLGIIQMLFGIVLSALNHVYFNDMVSVIFEFIPQFIFMTSIIGYLGLMIVLKWLYAYPPSLLNMLIQMFMSPGTVAPNELIYEGQGLVQGVLLLIAVICVPVMLFGKPLMRRREHALKASAGYGVVTNPVGLAVQDPPTHAPVTPESPVHPGSPGQEYTASESNLVSPAPTGAVAADGGSVEAFNFADVFVNQVIHTIEFVLGTISNTASYLRLWALSLAHAQLSEVLWAQVLEKTVGNFFVLFAAFYLWFCMTLGILIGMEGLSAFLHAMRLHWVEFNSKFYKGDGYPFTPFSFSSITANLDNDGDEGATAAKGGGKEA